MFKNFPGLWKLWEEIQRLSKTSGHPASESYEILDPPPVPRRPAARRYHRQRALLRAAGEMSTNLHRADSTCSHCTVLSSHRQLHSTDNCCEGDSCFWCIDLLCPPRVGGIKRRCASDVCLSRTGGLSREQRGLGRPKLAQR